VGWGPAVGPQIRLTFQRVEPVALPTSHGRGRDNMEPSLRVGQLAEATRVPAKTIRYYERVGVLPAPSRSPAGYREYDRRDIHRLLFIRRARFLGVPLAQLRDLTAGLQGAGCATMRPRLQRLVTEQLGAVQQQKSRIASARTATLGCIQTTRNSGGLVRRQGLPLLGRGEPRLTISAR
jgi:DNA-binding transcriptional MerR regulator